MGRKCSVENCLSDSNRPEDTGVTFHKVPLHQDVRPKWLSLCRIPEDKKTCKIIYVCSRHFLRADFCSFKGKKYMLRQGVLPSVFPWDKSKLEALKAEASIKKEPEELNVKNENEQTESSDIKPNIVIKPEIDTKSEEDIKPDLSTLPKIELQNPVESSIKVESKEKLEEFEKSKMPQTNPGSLTFSLNSRIEALDFNNAWYPAKVVEVDYEENEVLIHFEKFSSKYDEWISMNSSRLRPLQTGKKPIEKYVVGERCMASWSDCRKFPSTVTKVLENDTYEVLFDDGFVKTLKAHRMTKTQGKSMQSSPLFDPIKSSKQERRDKKRKLNVAALFKKRPRLATTEEKPKPSISQQPMEVAEASPSTDESATHWHPQWENGKPIGIESTIEANDGIRKSVIVSDPRLPPGWVKHLTQRVHGSCAGKWDTLIVGPDNRRFRARSEIRHYLENHPELKLNDELFDFSIYRNSRPRKSKALKKGSEVETQANKEPVEEIPPKEEEVPPISLKIIFEDEAYKCPIEGCGKTFRRENLALMHVKHYHSEYTKYLDSTPNVADLAYARTVGENLDKSPGPPKPIPPVPRQVERTSTPKAAKGSHSPQLAETSEVTPSTLPCQLKSKDAEIIKLLNQKPFDRKEPENIQPLPSGLPSNRYPDINLKDLLNKAEDMPKRDDINIKTLCATRPPMGIKTLLPVVRTAVNESAGTDEKKYLKRKRGMSENVEIIKGKDIPSPVTTQQPSHSPPPLSPLTQTTCETTPQSTTQHSPDSIIIEGGKIIKLERMKQEEIINCTCGYTEEDGLMIQCELCLCWQHAYCNNIQRESEVPEKYVCYICQHPLRERNSMKYIHDQDWLKQGTLPTASYHSKDEEVLRKRFEKLKKCHDISGGLLELREYLHTLSFKLKIAEAKNHPKLYLWSKAWEKHKLPEKLDIKEEKNDIKPKMETNEDTFIKNELDEKQDTHNDSMLMMILKAGKEDVPKIDLNTLMSNNIGQLSAPIIPQPQAAIDSDDCRLNLLDHIAHSESLVDERLDDFEKQIDALEDGLKMETEENYPKTRQTLQMLIKDLDTLKEFSQMPMI